MIVAMADTERVEDGEDSAFRAEFVRWLEEHPPPPAVPTGRRDPSDERWKPLKAWLAGLADAGYVAVSFPREFGGRGADQGEQAIVVAELARRGHQLPMGIGISMVAPTILAHGTEDQKKRFILPTLRGDMAWCQLYSEPGAGSDLAGLSTRAVRDGDEWVVNGQKVWTTQAHIADYAILLARTDPDQPKHRGITYFLIDMHQPGIVVRPLRQITGDAEFNEVFLTDARVGHDEVLGDVNGGWGVSMTTLLHERMLMSVASGGGGARGGKIDQLIALGRERGALSDPVLRQSLADGYIRSRILGYLRLRMQAAARAHREGPHPSLTKLYNARLQKDLNDIALRIEGPSALLWGADAPAGGAWQHEFLNSVQLRIAGGTDQVQMNVLGERALGLPPEPRVDKDVPFKDVANNPTRW